MFTGLIHEIGSVVRISRMGGGMMLTIQATDIIEGMHIGDSVSVNGACLTVTHVEACTFTVQAVEETLMNTTVGRWQRGERINLEPALRPSDRLGGHFVTGHVDAIGIIRSRQARQHSVMFSIEFPARLDPYVVVKGSVALDGVSLTVAGVADSRMEISIIPHTAEVTTFGLRTVGDQVNIEVDILGKYVLKHGRGTHAAIDEVWLREQGY